MFDIISDSFFVPLASPNKLVYWECICKLFSIMDNQLSFGVERDVLVDELQYYFEQTNAADFSEEELIRIYSASLLDEKSFYSPVEGRKSMLMSGCSLGRKRNFWQRSFSWRIQKIL